MIESVKWTAQDHLKIQRLRHCRVETLEIQSRFLDKTPWGTESCRFHALLIPSENPPRSGWPVVWWLSGFTGNGTKQFGFKGFEMNFAQEWDLALGRGQAPKAVVVCVDAWTPWGGSQFINSPAMGDMEDHLMGELLPALHEAYPVDPYHKKWAIAGGSSGGFGALHLASRHPGVFPWVVALAPDSFFERSLIPDILQARPVIEKLGGISELFNLLQKGKLFRRRNAHSLLNAAAMGLCYASKNRGRDFHWPIDGDGRLRKDIWKLWQRWDPLYFLPKRKAGLKRLRRVLLQAGDQDQFCLQYGARQIYKILRSCSVKVDYREFEGDHFDLGNCRPEVFAWLKKNWK